LEQSQKKALDINQSYQENRSMKEQIDANLRMMEDYLKTMEQMVPADSLVAPVFGCES